MLSDISISYSCVDTGLTAQCLAMAKIVKEGGFFQEGPGKAVELDPKKVLWTVARCFFGLGSSYLWVYQVPCVCFYLWVYQVPCVCFYLWVYQVPCMCVFIFGFTRCLVCVFYLWVYQVP